MTVMGRRAGRGTGLSRRIDAALSLAPLLVVATSLSILVGCEPSVDEATEPAATAIVSDAAGIRLLSVPAPFDLASNDADGLLLEVPESSGGGSVRITLSNEHPGGLNIIEAAKQEMANFEAMPDGQSFGQTKLMAPLGLTYMLRGRYSSGDVPSEELRAMVAHPWGNRLLTVAYVYPLGDDTSERGQELMTLLGEMEALPEPAAEETGSSESAETPEASSSRDS